VNDKKSPIDRALDLFVYGPLGFALEARRLLPDMVEKGRQQVSGQMLQAKVVGEYAVQQGQEDAGKALESLQHRAGSALETIGRLRGDVAPPSRHAPAQSGNSAAATRPASPPPPPPPAPPAAAPEPAATAPAPTDNSSENHTGAAATRDSELEVAALAIPDYDSLSASQVVPRLAGLSLDELEAVRGYEASHRGRKTILNRVAQLQAS
jgi:hypothetical protein